DGVIPIAEHLAMALAVVGCLRDANVEALHAPRERLLVVRLDDQMQVIRHHAELDEAHAKAIHPGAQGSPDAAEPLAGSKVRNVGQRTERDVERMALAQLGSGPARHERSASFAFGVAEARSSPLLLFGKKPELLHPNHF